jgi:hypothetical protein
MALEAASAQPISGEAKARAAVIRLLDHHAHGLAVHFDDARMGDGVRHASDRLGEVERRILAMGHPEQQNLPARIVHATSGAIRPVRR